MRLWLRQFIYLKICFKNISFRAAKTIREENFNMEKEQTSFVTFYEKKKKAKGNIKRERDMKSQREREREASQSTICERVCKS